MKEYRCLIALIIVCTKSYAQVPSYVPTGGLVAWYPFSGNAIDSSGHGYDGTNNGATLTTDRLGNANSAYHFDGVTSNISTSLLPPTGSAARTIACWFKYDALPAPCNSGLVIAGYGANTSSCSQVAKNFSLEVVFESSPPTARVDGVCVATDATQIADTLTNGWHFFAAVYDTSFGPNYDSIKIYVDGAYKKTSTVVFSSPITVNTGNFSNFLIGKGHYSCPRYFVGKIDDIGVWSRALTSCELLNLYMTGASSITTNPVNDTALSGGAATFSITAAGSILSYQWQVNYGFGFINLTNAAPYYDVNTQNLFINPVTKAMNGYKYRCIQNSGGCYDTSTAASLKIITLAVNEPEKEELVHIFPNPANGVVRVGAYFLISSIEVVNLVGQRVFYRKYNSNEAIIDVNDLAKGVYLIKINDSHIYKLIKQ